MLEHPRPGGLVQLGVQRVDPGLARTGVPLAVIPLGTGNLLARNLGLPIDLGRSRRTIQRR